MSFAEQRKEPSQHFHLYAASDGLETSTIPFTRNKYKKRKGKKKKKRAFGFATLCFLLHLKKKKKAYKYTSEIQRKAANGKQRKQSMIRKVKRTARKRGRKKQLTGTKQ